MKLEFLSILCTITLCLSQNVDEEDELKNFLQNFNGRNVACGGIGKSKRLQMVNPRQLPAECIYRIQPSSRRVCQVRIDFDTVLAQPTVPVAPATGSPICSVDSFSVGGLELCGTNRNQHVYVPLNVSRANRRPEIVLRFRLANRASNPLLTRFVSWNIRVTQLECALGLERSLLDNTESGIPPNPLTRTFSKDVQLIAPHGCLQFYPDREGTIESFNFNGGQGPYPGNLSYAICIRRRESDANIQFSATSFSLGLVNGEEVGFDANCLARVAVAGQSEDYLLIPDAVTAQQFRVTRFCGTTINGQTIIANPVGPVVLQFNSDNNFIPATSNEGGFQINYRFD